MEEIGAAPPCPQQRGDRQGDDGTIRARTLNEQWILEAIFCLNLYRIEIYHFIAERCRCGDGGGEGCIDIGGRQAGGRARALAETVTWIPVHRSERNKLHLIVFYFVSAPSPSLLLSLFRCPELILSLSSHLIRNRTSALPIEV